jgi:insertion element IS1 protein InsB
MSIKLDHDQHNYNSEESCWRLWHWIPRHYRHCHTFSDFWETYQSVFGTLAADHESVGKETGETAHVERWNNTLRQRLGRFVRKTLSFSKSDEYHEIALRLFLHEYNLTVISSYLTTTEAMRFLFKGKYI